MVYLPVGGALGAGLLVSAFVVPQPKLSASQDCYSACTSATSLSLSRSTVAVGNESDVEFRVKVTGEAFGTAKPTGSVDVETEKKIQQAIANLVQGRTTFAIAHRLSTLRNANRLVVMEKGEIVEVGTHAELLEKKGEFYKLVQTQAATSAAIAIGAVAG